MREFASTVVVVNGRGEDSDFLNEKRLISRPLSEIVSGRWRGCTVFYFACLRICATATGSRGSERT